MGAFLDVSWWRWVGFVPMVPALLYALWGIGQLRYDWLDKDDDVQHRMGRLLHAGAYFQFAVAFFMLWTFTDTSSRSGAVALMGMGLYLLVSSWAKRPTRLSSALSAALLRSHRRKVSSRS